MPRPITEQQIKQAVQKFWSVFLSKSAEALAEFYSHEATVLTPHIERPEPGRVSAIRRKREYFHPQSTLTAQLGPIEVLLLGDCAAVACYSYSFAATNVAAPEFGRGKDLNFKSARATQVFAVDAEGRLVIVHEHLSLTAEV